MLLQAAIYISLRGYTLRQINIKEWASLPSLNHTFPLPAPIPLNEERGPTAGAGRKGGAPGIFLKTDGHRGPEQAPPGNSGGCRGPACLPQPPPLPRSPCPAPCLLAYEKCSNNEWLLFTEVISCYISIIAWICLASHTTPLPTMNF